MRKQVHVVMRLGTVAVCSFLAAGWSGPLTGTARAATITHNFNGDAGTVPAGWNTSTIQRAGATSLGTGTPLRLDGAGRYANTLTPGNNQESINASTFTVADRQAGTDFSVTTHFTNPGGVTTQSPGAGWNTQVAVRVLANTAQGIDGAGDQYLDVRVFRNNANQYFWNVVNRIAGTSTRLEGNVDNVKPLGFVPFEASDSSTLTVIGDYTATGLKITATYSDGTSSNTLSDLPEVPLASIPTGSNFGVYTRARNFSTGGITTPTSFGDYSLTYAAVPEPAGLALLGLGGIALLRRRRTA